MKFKYFNQLDFINAVPSCNIEKMDIDFLLRLDKAREIAGLPFIINSAYRSVDWEKIRGRSGYSSHCKGLAVDISCKCSYDRLIIVKALIEAGFNRIGVYDTFVHVDDDLTKVQCLFIG